jgi:aspartyl/asparaginyl beta-hydroxylase (cupin superfamily)
MIILHVLAIVLLALVLFIGVIYLIEPSLLAIPFSFFMSLFLKNKPFVDCNTHFPKHQLLQENWETIRDELLLILQNEEGIPKFHEIDKIQKYISARDDVPWRTFMFKAYDNWMASNCALAPKTTALLKEIPEITTAMFSILSPRKHIPPHRGFYKGVWRYHLGLIIPQNGDCFIVNGGQQYHWKPGEDVLFDDTFNHQVWNKSDELRVVLFCDVYRNDLPGIFKPLNRWVFKERVKSKRLKRAVKNAEVMHNM